MIPRICSRSPATCTRRMFQVLRRHKSSAWTDRQHPAANRDDEKELRRRHLQSVYDTSDNWRDWLSPEEYRNPWDTSLPTLEYPPAEYATRHVLQLLQELFHAGRPLSDDRITTERCNHVLKQLLATPDIEGRAARADVILKTMELWDNHRVAKSTTDQRLPLSPPRPNPETYALVLQLYARTAGSRAVPDRAREIVEKMQWRYEHLRELDMKPHQFHWSQVLHAWKECTDWDRAVHAAQLVLNLRNNNDTDSLGRAAYYILLLRICGHNVPNEKAALLGANVAIKLWQEVVENEDDDGDTKDNVADFPSHFYSHFLQAIRCLPKGKKLRETYFHRGFERARRHGKINAIVLKEFAMHVGDTKNYGKYFGRFKDRIRDAKSQKEKTERLYALIPADWKARADISNKKSSEEK